MAPIWLHSFSGGPLENGRDTKYDDWAMADNPKTSFFELVYEIVAMIPYGRVVSYGQIARMLGSPRAARTVGWALSSCPDDLPWQRVVRSDGSIAGGGFAELRSAMLLEEGVSFLPDGRVDMAACEWDGDASASYEECDESEEDGNLLY